MQFLFDIIGSFIVAGVILGVVFNMNATMGSMTFQNTLDVITQENAKSIADLVNYDFYKIGYGDSTTDPVPIIKFADTNAITFKADIDSNGTLDTVQYYTTPPYFVAGSQYKFEKLCRAVNSTNKDTMVLGIASFKLSYYDTFGVQINPPPLNTVSLLQRIESIKIQMLVKNPI